MSRLICEFVARSKHNTDICSNMHNEVFLKHTVEMCESRAAAAFGYLTITVKPDLSFHSKRRRPKLVFKIDYR